MTSTSPIASTKACTIHGTCIETNVPRENKSMVALKESTN